MTPQEVAAEINELKPNLTDFWNLIKQDKYLEVLNLTNNTSVTLFMLELLSIYNKIHPHVYVAYRTEQKLVEYQKKVNFHIILIRDIDINLILKDITQHSDLISAHIHNFKQYLNPYLYKKFGFTKSNQKSIVKLEENEFSLELFKNALGKRKIPSTEGIKYFNQIKEFKPELCDKFMDVIFEHCSQPSINFQHIIEESNLFLLTSSTSSKYINLSRIYVRDIAYKFGIPISEYLFDARDSDYAPFTCGIPRKPIPTIQEISSLISIMLLIANSEHEQKEYIVNCIKEHLQNPAYDSIYAKYKKNLQKYSTNLSNLLKDH